MTVLKTLKKVVFLLLSIGICLFAGYIGSLFTTPSIPTWYAGLLKPDLTPPSWLFAPVWTALFIIMGISLYLILQSDISKGDVFEGFLLFILQLGLNVAWSYIFFGGHEIFLALMCIIALLAFLLSTIIQVSRFSIAGAALLLPYLLWIVFTTYLNYAIMVLNP